MCFVCCFLFRDKKYYRVVYVITRSSQSLMSISYRHCFARFRLWQFFLPTPQCDRVDQTTDLETATVFTFENFDFCPFNPIYDTTQNTGKNLIFPNITDTKKSEEIDGLTASRGENHTFEIFDFCPFNPIYDATIEHRQESYFSQHHRYKKVLATCSSYLFFRF